MTSKLEQFQNDIMPNGVSASQSLTYAIETARELGLNAVAGQLGGFLCHRTAMLREIDDAFLVTPEDGRLKDLDSQRKRILNFLTAGILFSTEFAELWDSKIANLAANGGGGA